MQGQHVMGKFILLFLGTLAASLNAQTTDEIDTYKVRISGFWFYSSPTGNFQGGNDTGTIDLQKDLGFASYSTFSGKLDWKFTHKNHLYLVGSSFDQSRETILTRTVTFKGQTYEVGVSTRAQLSAPMIAPGYQFDFLRRRRGHLGVAVQIDLFDASASLTATGQATGGGTVQGTISGKESLLAPIPVAGPEFRLYLTNSPRLFVEGQVYGMYFFGYGNFVSTAGNVGVTVVKHLSLNAGYQLGTRLVVNNDIKRDRFGLQLTQKGPIVGAELTF